MEEASGRAEAIKVDAKEMWSQMQEDLSKEDVLGIAEGRWLAPSVQVFAFLRHCSSSHTLSLGSTYKLLSLMVDDSLLRGHEGENRNTCLR